MQSHHDNLHKKNNTRAFYSRKVLYAPLYYHDLATYPETNPILIAVDKPSAYFIRRLRGICLGCYRSPSHYDLAFCFLKEVWVLYSHTHYFQTALHLAQAIQQNGATKILALRIQL